VPGGRWDVALAAERSAWRQANGLALGPTKHIYVSIIHVITRVCFLYLLDDCGCIVTEFQSMQTEPSEEHALPDANVGRIQARRAHELEIVKRNARIVDAKRKAGVAITTVLHCCSCKMGRIVFPFPGPVHLLLVDALHHTSYHYHRKLMHVCIQY
jgi:hypothetical protein